MEPEENTVNLQALIRAVVSKTDISRKISKYLKFEPVAKATQGSLMRGKFVLFSYTGQLLNRSYLNGN